MAPTSGIPPVAPSWPLQALHWLGLALASAIVGGLVGGMVIKTWWDLKFLPRWREHRDQQHLENLLANGRVLRLQFQAIPVDGDIYATPIRNHPELSDGYRAWFNHCDKILAVLSARWHRRWWLDGSRLVGNQTLDASSLGACLMALDQDLTILQTCYKQADWPKITRITNFRSRLHARWTLFKYRRERNRQPISILAAEPQPPVPSEIDPP